MKWSVAIILLSTAVMSWSAQGQYLSHDGKFQVDQVKGCAPFTVTVTPSASFPCNSTEPCAAFYEDGTTSEPLITPPFQHTYTQPGIYTLKILRSALYDSIRIEVTPNIPPDFDVYNCGNNVVSVKINDTHYDEYVVDYKDGSPSVVASSGSTLSHAYASSSPQTVEVRGRNTNADDNCSTAGKIITPLVTLPTPTITLLEVLDDQSIRIAFDAASNVQYKLGIATNNNTTFQQAKTLYNQTVDTIFNLHTDQNYYCFQLAAFDPCNNAVFNSATICSATLDLGVRNNAIDVKWKTSTTGISNFLLDRNAADGTNLKTNPSGSPYADLGVTCGMEYCYQLTVNYPNGSRSVSAIRCGTGFSTDIPTTITNITAGVTDQSALLQWQTDPNFIPAEFKIEKSIGGQPYTLLSTTTTNAFADEKFNIEEAPCYRIRYTDLCGNESDVSIEVCPIILTGRLLKDNAISLTWSAYQGWKNGVSNYIIEKYAQDGTLLQTFNAGTNTSYVDESADLDHQTFVYVVKAAAVDTGLGQAVSNKVFILKNPNLFHPTAFTPNGDNLNDHFTVLGQYVVGFQMSIFNRWGELLFNTTDINAGWDGTFKGKEMPEGTYTFIAYITDRAGRTFKRSGSVLLLRK